MFKIKHIAFEFLLNLTLKVMNSDEQFKEKLDKSVIIELFKKNVIRFPDQNTLNTKVKQIRNPQKEISGGFF
jgi:hypothetical protein